MVAYCLANDALDHPLPCTPIVQMPFWVFVFLH